jgi:hypothetical protein
MCRRPRHRKIGGPDDVTPGAAPPKGAREMAQDMLVFTAVYDDVESALMDLDALEQLHKDDVIGKFDAAVVDQEDGKPHIVKRMDRPRMRIIPEMFGKGTLPRKELHDAAQDLTSGEAGLIAAGEPTLAKGFDKAIARATKTAKREFNATSEELSNELKEALKGE